MTAAEQCDQTYDLIVLGGGAGGMTAALVAGIEGLSTLLIERTDRIGGTTARSSGTVWIPDNPYQRALGVTDDAVAASAYLDALVGDRADRALREAFIGAGPEMLEYLARHTDIAFEVYTHHPDYRPELPGAAHGGRPLEPLPFDGRTLGAEFDRVATPLPELMLFGGMMVTRGEAARLQRIATSLSSFALGARLIGRYLVDRMRFRRGTRLVLGNALAARLYKNLLERRITVWFESETTQLIAMAGRVVGIVVNRASSGPLRVRARRGVVLAGGGFPAGRVWRERHLPQPVAAHTPAYEACTGETLRLALKIGGALGPAGEDNALWFPSSIARRKDGSTAVYPHIVLDRAKPGLIAVNAAGARFVDEAVSYHEFTRAMYRSHRRVPSIPAWLVCDRRFIWRYGLGMIRPLRLSLRSYIDSGYLQVAPSVAALARRIGVDEHGLRATVRIHNDYARSGQDADFGKGGNVYDRANGDATQAPNPCLGPIETPPFCAVAVVPTPLGTSLGLRTNHAGQVCDQNGRPIAGLYACGNDMHSVMGGEYPGAGAQIGAAMTFGYLVAQHAARHAAIS